MFGFKPSSRVAFSIRNLISNGSFEQLSNWSFSSHYQGAGYSLSSDQKSFVGNKSAKGVVLSTSVAAICRNNAAHSWVNGHKYYVMAHLYPLHNTATKLEIGSGAEVRTNYATIDSVIPNQWNRLSAIINYTTTEISPTKFGVIHDNNEPYISGDSVYFDGFLAIDLTEKFGAGEEPEIEEMDMLMDWIPGNWFDGVISIPYNVWFDIRLKYIQQQIDAIVSASV